MSRSEACMENLRINARTAKAIAVQKLKMEDYAGAKAYVLRAKELNPVLTGLHRLNAIIDLMIGFQKRINGEVDWYAVLGVDPTADLATIQKRNRKLLLCIVMDDGDDSVGSVGTAQDLLYHSWRIFCNENFRKLYDKRRQERAKHEKEQELKRASQGSSVSCSPEVTSAPNPPQRVSEENERTVQPPSGAPVIVSPSPPQRPEMFNGEKEKLFEVEVREELQVPSSSLSATEAVVKSPRVKMFNEENEEIVEVSIKEVAQPPLPSSRRGGEGKRKAPMSLLHAKQLRRISEEAGINSIERTDENDVPSMTIPSAEGYVSASQHVNVASSSAAKAPQESNKFDAVSASQHVNVASSSAAKAPQESNKFDAASASQHVNVASSSKTKAPQESNKFDAVSAPQHVNVASSSAAKAPQESNKFDAVSASQHVNDASSSATKVPQESNKCTCANRINTQARKIFEILNSKANVQVYETKQDEKKG